MKMTLTRWLWALWAAMGVSMLLRQRADPYMIVGLIILPILIVLLELREEILVLKEENKHQRKFVMDRYNAIQDRLKDMSSQIEKRLVVDFSEFAQNNPPVDPVRLPPSAPDEERESVKKIRKLKKRKRVDNMKHQMMADFAALSGEDSEEPQPESNPEQQPEPENDNSPKE